MTNQTAPHSPAETSLARARRQVRAIKGFYIHLAAFTAVMLVLLALDLGIGRGWWVHWVLLGWGVGIVAHALAVYGRAPRFVAEWEQRKLRQIMNRPR